MSPLVIPSAESTPFVNLDPEKGILEIRGVSYDEDSLSFYKKIFEWLDQYINNPQEKTELNINLRYFNTSSAKCLYDLLEMIKLLDRKGKAVEINWFYTKDDDSMKDEIENFRDILEYPINIKESN